MPLKVGDVVVLKSGGPKMTVAAVKQERVFCTWFNQRDQYHEERTCEFLVETLSVLRPKPSSARRSAEPAQPDSVQPEPEDSTAP